jgi:hypothetical protein
MRPARFETLLADAARHIPVVDGVKTLADAGHTEHPFGVAAHLRDGAQAWWSFTVQSRSDDRYSEPEAEPISGERPEPIAMPEFPAGDVAMSDLELALASQLLALDTHAEIKEIQRFSQWPDKGAIPYGLKVVFHPGGADAAKAFVNSLATVRAGQDAPRGRWYEVPATV